MSKEKEWFAPLMFTGIVEATAQIIATSDGGLTIERPRTFDDLKIGSSVCVSGVCLTVVAFTRASMSFDVVPETRKRTTIGSLKKGDAVNLERALKAGGRLEGHIVQGHVDGVGEVVTFESPSPNLFCAQWPPPPTPPPLGGGENRHSPHPQPLPLKGEGRNYGGDYWSPFKGTDHLRFPPGTVVDHAREMRRNPTEAENMLWEHLQDHRLGGYHFRRQRPIGAYIADFYSETAHLAVELDGGIHEAPAMAEKDADREVDFDDRGIRILRFRNEEVLHNLSHVLATILETMQESPSSSLSSPPPLGGGAGGGGFSQNERGVGGGGSLITVSFPSSLRKLIVEKGSIAVDGVSLTITSVDDSTFSVALIPHTLEETTLGELKEGDHVNIEADVLGKYLRQK